MAKLRVDKIAASGQTSENTGSVFFDGTGDYFDISKEPFQFLHKLTHAWTVECWFYKTSDAQGTLFDTGGSSDTAIGTAVYINTGGDVRLRVRQALSGTVVSEDNAGAVSLNTWHHFALTFDGQVIRTFIDGAIISTVNYSTQSSTDSTQTLKIGVYEFDGTSKGGYFQGYISNFRICKGHAVYTSNFVVPTRELEVHQGPDDDRTVLLCCYDGENIFADKSGRHIIAAYGDRTSSPTPTATDSPIGITTFQPGLTRSVDVTDGPVFQGGAGYTSQNWLTLPKGTTTDRNRTGGRGIFAGGGSSPYTNAIEFITISSSGNAQDFGDLTQEKQSLGGTANSTRGIFASGYNAPVFPASGHNTDRIDYISIASQGNAVTFGSIESAIRYASCAANSTRGLIAGGYTPTYIDRIEYITIATLGDAQDFGDLTANGTATDKAGLSSPTRALFAGGEGPSMVSQIDYVTIATLGDAADFGDLTAARRRASSASSGTRGLVAAGYNGSSYVDTIDYVTIASLGNAQDFGNVTQSRSSSKGQTCSTIRGVFGSGKTPSVTNTIDYVTIASTGDANDFGDTNSVGFEQAGCSDSHGGIS
jgi:hypothetical protein